MWKWTFFDSLQFQFYFRRSLKLKAIIIERTCRKIPFILVIIQNSTKCDKIKIYALLCCLPMYQLSIFFACGLSLHKVGCGLKHVTDKLVIWGKYSRPGLESITEFRVYGELKYLKSNKMQNNAYLRKFAHNLTHMRPKMIASQRFQSKAWVFVVFFTLPFTIFLMRGGWKVKLSETITGVP